MTLDNMDLSNSSTSPSHPLMTDNKPKLINKIQTLCVRHGSVNCQNRATDISSVSEVGDSCKDGVFWKLSEFHRRSGKQGLEERFKLLSPTVIVSCSGKNDDSYELDVGQNRSEVSNEPNETEETKDTRCLRKRQPVDYFPKDGVKQPKPENVETGNMKNLLTVLHWYKAECRFRRDKLKKVAGVQCDAAESSHEQRKIVRTHDLHLWQTKTVKMSIPDNVGKEENSENTDKVFVTAYIKGDIMETQSSMNMSIPVTEAAIIEDNKNIVCYSSKDMADVDGYIIDALNLSFKSDIVKDFEIDGLLNELDSHPVALPESEQEGVCHESMDHINESQLTDNITAESSEVLNTCKEYTAEPILMVNHFSSYQDRYVDYVNGHWEHEENGSESMFSGITNEDEEFGIIKKQVEHVRNGSASPSLDAQLGNKAQTHELPQEKVSLPREKVDSEACAKTTIDTISDECNVKQEDTHNSMNYAENSDLDNSSMSEHCIENKTDKVKKISNQNQACYILYENDSMEDHHKHLSNVKPGAGKRKINGSRILNRLKTDVSVNGQSFKEIGEAMALPCLTDDKIQNYFQSIPEKVKFEQRRKRRLSGVEETLIKHTYVVKDGEYSDQYSSEPYPNCNSSAVLMDIETEPLNLSMHSKCSGDMNMHSTPVKKRRLSFTNGAMKISKNRQDRLQRNKTKKPKCVKMFENSPPAISTKETYQFMVPLQCGQTSIQPEPLDLSNHGLKSATVCFTQNSEEASITVNKRVLRNHAPVKYFPEKKPKKDNTSKGLKQNEIQVENSWSGLRHQNGRAKRSLSIQIEQPSNDNVKDRDHVDNKTDCRPYFYYFDPMELSPEPIDLSMANKDKHAVDLEMEQQIEGLCHGLHKEVSVRDTDSERMTKNDARRATTLQKDAETVATDIDVNNNAIMDPHEINECELDEHEKAINVQTVLTSLYCKERPPKTLLNGSGEFINSMGTYELDEFMGQEDSYPGDGKTAEDQEHLLGLVNDIKKKDTNITELQRRTNDSSHKDKLCLNENSDETSTFGSNSDDTDVMPKSNKSSVSECLAIQKATEHTSKKTCSFSGRLDSKNKPTEELNIVVPSGANVKSKASYMPTETGTFTKLCGQLDTWKVKNTGLDVDGVKLSSKEPVVAPSSTVTQQGYPVGTVVWGKFSKSRWWPAVVIDGRMLKRETRHGYQWIFWLSDHRVSQLKVQYIELFTSQYKARTSGKLKDSMKIGVLKALKICAERADLDLESFQSVEEWGWADSGFIKCVEDAKNGVLFPTDDVLPLPSYILEQLGIIRSKSVDRVTVPDDIGLDDSGVADLDSLEDSGCAASERERKPPKKLIGIRPYRGRDVMDCLSCDLPLTEEYQRYNHLLFEGYICGKCKDWMMSSFYATDDDDTSLYCGICGEGGTQFVCEKQLCGRAFCHNCIERISGKQLVKQIQQTDPWYCFMCTEYSVATHGNLVPRNDWQHEVIQFFQPDNIPLCNDLHYLTSEKKRKIRVLSLFDGIGTGKQVLNELGLDVEVYYASEVNEDAKLVATCHHAVTHVGDAWRLTRDRLKGLCPIDLVLAGPPCNDLSIVNPLRKGFNGTGILVVKFISILKDIERLCENNHVFWLLENTGSMFLEYKETICSLLGMEPAMWDAIHFTGQRRARNFWGNIPGLYSTPEYCRQLQKDKTDLEAALHTNCNRTARIPHLRTVTTGKNSLTIRNGEDALPILMDGKEDGIWVSELERVFGFPDHYTDVANLTPSTRHRLLGKAWCVPVIKHILSPLRHYFALKEA